jgi:hypothetical protein
MDGGGPRIDAGSVTHHDPCSDGDNGFALGGPLSDVADRLRGLAQREGSVDDRVSLPASISSFMTTRSFPLGLEKNERSRWRANSDNTTALRVRPVP